MQRLKILCYFGLAISYPRGIGASLNAPRLVESKSEVMAQGWWEWVVFAGIALGAREGVGLTG